MPTTKRQEILIVRLSSLGDVLMTFPAVEALKTAHPSARISYLTDQRFATLPQGCPAVDAVLPIDKRGLRKLNRAGVCRTLKTMQTLTTGRFDVAVDFHSYPETGFLVAASRAPVRVGRRAKTVGMWYTNYLPAAVGERPLPGQHVELLQFAGLVPKSAPVPALRVVPDDVAMAEARAWMREKNLDPPSGPVIAVFPGASRPEKCWPVECFASMLSQVLNRWPGAVAVIFGGPKEAELINELQGRLQSFWDRLFVTPPFLPLPYVAALRALAPNVFVSNDTGPMHLAVAAGVSRVVALYAAENLQFQPPAPHIVLTSPNGDLKKISVDDVCGAVCNGQS